MPKTVQDALQIARALEIPYLWVDRFCIIQDSEKDWEIESAKMCHVYRHGVCTISADCSADALDGIFQKQAYANIDYRELGDTGILVTAEVKHPTIDAARRDKTDPLNRRSWCLQEHILSTRILHFTNNELVWQCATRDQCECGRTSGRSTRLLNVLGSELQDHKLDHDDEVSAKMSSQKGTMVHTA